MRDHRLQIIAMLLGLFCATVARAQQLQPTGTTTVPKLVRFNGSFRPANGQQAQPVESVTLSVYSEQTGGTPLWQETQNVAVDGEGKYSVLMGATQNDGVPLDLLSAGEPRWLGAQFNRPGEPEQPRVLMASVPYALKSVDAETLGGKPASAYLLAPSGSNLTSGAPSSTGAAASTGATASTTVPTNVTTAVKPRATNGTAGFIGVFTDANDLGNSVMQQSNGNIGIGTAPGAAANTTPSLDLRTYPFSQIGMAQTVDYLTFFASDAYGPAIYWDPTKDLRLGKGGNQLYGAFGFVEQMRIQSATGNVGIGTMNPGSALDVAGDINYLGSLRMQGYPILQLGMGQFGPNLALGPSALPNIYTHGPNTALGVLALSAGTSGFNNTAVGYAALLANLTGGGNTALGNTALQLNTSGSFNTAIGDFALMANNTGMYNTAIGGEALTANTTGSGNTAVGTSTLQHSTTAGGNTAIGDGAMANSTTGENNIAIGSGTLSDNQGDNNTAVGVLSMASNIGSSNTSLGRDSLGLNTTGSNNIAVGYQAGFLSGPANSNNIHVGNTGSSSDSAVIRIGTLGTQTSFFVAGVNGVTTTNSAVPVLIDTTNGQLGVASSSRRYKEDIEDMGDASRDLMRLRPVTFRYKKPFADGSKPIQYGLIAEEVDEVYPDLVAHSADGQIETVKYQVLDSMLLNEVQRQQAEIGAQKEQLQKLEQRLNAQTQQNASLLERLDKLEAVLGSASRVSGVAAVR
jgi:hypothetical protein